MKIRIRVLHGLRCAAHKIGPSVGVFIIVFLLMTDGMAVFSQSDIPLGTWRLHVSYNTINSIALGGNVVYAASDNGVMVLDKRDNSITTYTKLNGLSGSGISALCADQSSMLLIGYDDGRLDVIHDHTVKKFDPARGTDVTGSKKINHISIHGRLAYLSTDYGVVIFDLDRIAVKETWRDLGSDGDTYSISRSAFKGDSIFLATEKGVIAGDLQDNLLDYTKWKRFETSDFSTAIQGVVSFGDKIYATINAKGIYSYAQGQWTLEPYLQGNTFQSAEASANHLTIIADNRLWLATATGAIQAIEHALLAFPKVALQDADGHLWVGDGKAGLVSDFSGSFTSYLSNGPSTSRAFRLKFYDGKLYLVPGGYTSNGQPQGASGELNFFEQGQWRQQPKSMEDLTDIDFSASGTLYLSSFGYGVEAVGLNGNVIRYDDTNSPLVNTSPPGKFVTVSAIENSAAGVWVANYGASQSLHLLNSNNVWESFSFPIVASRYPTDLVIDYTGNPWMVLQPSQGGGIVVFNKASNTYSYLTQQTGAGQLPSRAVRSIAVDRDGYIWVGTDEGIAYFFDASTDAVRPIFENRFLLRDDKITAIAVDGGNRKWIGTERGVWLFDPTGEALVYNFTAANSALLSDNIVDIEINALTGEVFFATDKGIISFRSDATEATSSFQQIKIFPNPVTPNFSGAVGITGLAADAIVKITDISGRLMWQVQANGGTAMWNLNDHTGKKVNTGVYLVFAASADGSEHAIGKIAVIE